MIFFFSAEEQGLLYHVAFHLCEKYYKLITIQYNIAYCVSWVPRLTLTDLQTHWTYELAPGMELSHM